MRQNKNGYGSSGRWPAVAGATIGLLLAVFAKQLFSLFAAIVRLPAELVSLIP